jgi:hypothetical protein
MKSTREIYDPSLNIIRDVNQKYRCDKVNNRLIYRGIITFVDRVGNDSRPPFSLRAKVFGIDDPSSDDVSENFYPSLFPPHLISIPEVGEEILIICEEVGNLRSGFWISRYNSNNTLTKVNVGYDDDSSINISDKLGIDTETIPKEKYEDSPDDAYPIPETRFKPGDTLEQGRSNTIIKHSFDKNNKKGYIELVTESQDNGDKFFQDDFQKSNGARLILATLSNIDDEIISKTLQKTFSETFSGIKNSNSAYLLLEAAKLRLISRDGGQVQSAVLAENQEIWLKALTEQIVKLIDQVDKLKSAYDSHTQDAGLLLDSTGKPCTGKTSSPTSSGVVVEPIKSAVNDLNSKIKDHHSRVLAIN